MLKQLPLSATNLPGVWTALVTPFTRKGINLPVFEELIGIACDADITGVVPLGTTGESPSLEDSERISLIKTAISTARGRIKIVVGAGVNNTSKTIGNIKQAADLGADGALVVAPYYNKPTVEGLRRHFLMVAEESDLPIILYHIPGRCGVGIPLNLVLELAKHPMIVGIKEAGGEVWRSGEIARLAGEDFAVLSGDDNLTLALMAVGAKGVISVISNLLPKTFNDLVKSALKGDFSRALKVHRDISPLLSALSLETNPSPIKEAMNLRGIRVGMVRMPLAPARTDTKKSIKNALDLVSDLD